MTREELEREAEIFAENCIKTLAWYYNEYHEVMRPSNMALLFTKAFSHTAVDVAFEIEDDLEENK